MSCVPELMDFGSFGRETYETSSWVCNFCPRPCEASMLDGQETYSRPRTSKSKYHIRRCAGLQTRCYAFQSADGPGQSTVQASCQEMAGRLFCTSEVLLPLPLFVAVQDPVMPQFTSHSVCCPSCPWHKAHQEKRV